MFGRVSLVGVLLPLTNGGNACYSEDTTSSSLTSSGRGADGILLCTYTSGVCVYSSVNGELDTSASTSTAREILITLLPTSVSNSAIGASSTSSGSVSTTYSQKYDSTVPPAVELTLSGNSWSATGSSTATSSPTDSTLGGVTSPSAAGPLKLSRVFGTSPSAADKTLPRTPAIAASLGLGAFFGLLLFVLWCKRCWDIRTNLNTSYEELGAGAVRKGREGKLNLRMEARLEGIHITIPSLPAEPPPSYSPRPTIF
ncbi:hypothetical protein K438DRAFT_1977732 [Mycena galopus ATCC 62051]|nr:hypothetical protein K438DRAFT_1977732 [Mycena galopus ATCC 62051]